MLAFCHNNLDKYSLYRDACNWKQGTIAIDLPLTRDIDAMYQSFSEGIVLLVGAARLSSKERFVKSNGREYASKALAATKCYVEYVELKTGKKLFHFKASVSNKCPGEESVQDIKFGLSMVENNEKVHLLYAHFN